MLQYILDILFASIHYSVHYCQTCTSLDAEDVAARYEARKQRRIGADAGFVLDWDNRPKGPDDTYLNVYLRHPREEESYG